MLVGPPCNISYTALFIKLKGKAYGEQQGVAVPSKGGCTSPLFDRHLWRFRLVRTIDYCAGKGFLAVLVYQAFKFFAEFFYITHELRLYISPQRHHRAIISISHRIGDPLADQVVG